MRIGKIEQLITINNKLNLIGSRANDKIKYKTDYDYQEIIGPDLDLLKKFQTVCKNICELPDAYVVDFKAGIYLSQPIRWVFKEIMNGYKCIDSKIIYFVDCLHNDHNIVKIDIIAYVDNEYVEISCNYYFTETNKSVDEIYLSLMQDVKKYYNGRQYMKLYKRIYSYRSIKGEDVSELMDIFNSKIGYLNQILHKVDVVRFIKEHDILEPVNIFKLDNMIKHIYKTIPEKFRKIKDLHELKTNLENLINKLLSNY